MRLIKSERVVIIVLSILLLIGSIILKNSRFRVCKENTILQYTTNKEVELKKIEKLLHEKRKVNLNTATFEELISVPGVGETLAARIINYRLLNQRFYCEDDLLRIKGVGKKKLEQIREYIKFD